MNHRGIVLAENLKQNTSSHLWANEVQGSVPFYKTETQSSFKLHIDQNYSLRLLLVYPFLWAQIFRR